MALIKLPSRLKVWITLQFTGRPVRWKGKKIRIGKKWLQWSPVAVVMFGSLVPTIVLSGITGAWWPTLFTLVPAVPVFLVIIFDNHKITESNTPEEADKVRARRAEWWK